MLRDDPKAAQAMMGELYGRPLLSPNQVAGVVLSLLDEHVATQQQRQQGNSGGAGAAGGSEGGAAGMGPVRMLLQNGRVVDPFAPSRAATASSQRGAQPPRAGAAPAAGTAAQHALARFTPAALASYAAQQLPGSYQAVVVTRLGSDFRAVSALVSRPMPAAAALPPGQLLVRRLWAGVNASDVNFSAGRYHASKAEAQAQLPLAAGFESVCVVVAAAPDVKGVCSVSGGCGRP